MGVEKWETTQMELNTILEVHVFKATETYKLEMLDIYDKYLRHKFY